MQSNRALVSPRQRALDRVEREQASPRLRRMGNLALLYVVADALNRGSALLLMPLYTRFMSPDDYGILALASMISSLLVMLLSFGGSSVVVRFYNQFSDPQERTRFLGSFWVFLVLAPGLLIGAIYLAADSLIAPSFRTLPLHPYIELILGTAYLNIAFGTVLPNLLRAREQAGRYLALSLTTMLLTVGFSFYLVVFQGLGAVGALGAQFGALAVVSLVSAVYLARTLSPGLRPPELRLALRYGLPLVPHFAAHWTLSISDRAVLERFVGLGGLGLYSLAYQFGTLLQMLFTSINQALAPAFSRAANRRDDLQTLARLTTYYYLAVLAMGLGVALAAKDVIVLITPPSYHEAGRLVPYITLGVVAMGFYFIPMNLLSMTAGRTSVIPLITLVAGGVNVALNLLLVPQLGVLAAAVNTAVGYGVLAVLTTAYAGRIITLNYEVARIAKGVLASLLLYITGSLIGGDNPLLHLSVGILAVACLPLLLWLLGFWTDDEKRGLARILRLSHA